MVLGEDIFTGVFGYADDLVLLAPSLNALKIMINTCEGNASDYQIVYNRPTDVKINHFHCHSLSLFIANWETSCDILSWVYMYMYNLAFRGPVQDVYMYMYVFILTLIIVNINLTILFPQLSIHIPKLFYLIIKHPPPSS